MSRFAITTPRTSCDFNNYFYHIHSNVKDLTPSKQGGFSSSPFLAIFILGINIQLTEWTKKNQDLLFCQLILSNVTSRSLTLSQILTHQEGVSSGKGERAMTDQLSLLEALRGVRHVF